MDKKPLISKYLSVGIIFLLLVTYGVPAVAHPLDDNQPQCFIFSLGFAITLHWHNGTQEPISPGETREVNLTIIFFVYYGAFARWLLHLLEGKLFPFQLYVEDKPDWCEAWIIPENMTGVIQSDDTVRYSSLFIHLNDDAPSNYTQGIVKIRTTVDSMKGPFKLITLIQGYENDYPISFVTGTGL
jgi:hypothetical protein